MAVEFYVEQSDRAYQSGVAAEQVYAGELISDSAGSVAPLAFADGDYDGLALYNPEFMAAEDEDDVRDEYAEAGDLVQYAPDEDSAVVHIRTPEDNGTAPSISHGDVVGIADLGSTEGRVVEEGYDDGATVYDRSNNNFLAIGEAVRPAKQSGDSVTDFDVPVRVELNAEAQE